MPSAELSIYSKRFPYTNRRNDRDSVTLDFTGTEIDTGLHLDKARVHTAPRVHIKCHAHLYILRNQNTSLMSVQSLRQKQLVKQKRVNQSSANYDVITAVYGSMLNIIVCHLNLSNVYFAKCGEQYKSRERESTGDRNRGRGQSVFLVNLPTPD